MRDGEGSLHACLDFGRPSELGPRWSLLRRVNRYVSLDQQALMEGYVASAESTHLLRCARAKQGGAHPAAYAPASDRHWDDQKAQRLFVCRRERKARCWCPKWQDILLFSNVKCVLESKVAHSNLRLRREMLFDVEPVVPSLSRTLQAALACSRKPATGRRINRAKHPYHLLQVENRRFHCLDREFGNY